MENLKRHILDGEVLYAAPSRMVISNYNSEPLDIYAELKNIAPDDHMYYIIDKYGVSIGCGADAILNVNGEEEKTVELRILTKFVQVDAGSPLSEMVTAYSNNQNAVRPRDSKANDSIQIRLQNEFQRNYTGQYCYEIKRGESSGSGEIIVNEDMGIYLWVFDLKEPWATHRKYQIFEDKYADIFGRPQVTADRIVMCNLFMKKVVEILPEIENQLFGKYVLTKYLLLYILRNILEQDEIGREVINKPEKFVRNHAERSKLGDCVSKVIRDTIIDINAEVEKYGDDFDYRGRLRDADWVKKLSSEIVGTYIKLVQRGRLESFGSEWKK